MFLKWKNIFSQCAFQISYTLTLQCPKEKQLLRENIYNERFTNMTRFIKTSHKA